MHSNCCHCSLKENQELTTNITKLNLTSPHIIYSIFLHEHLIHSPQKPFKHVIPLLHHENRFLEVTATETPHLEKLSNSKNYLPKDVKSSCLCHHNI